MPVGSRIWSYAFRCPDCSNRFLSSKKLKEHGCQVLNTKPKNTDIKNAFSEKQEHDVQNIKMEDEEIKETTDSSGLRKQNPPNNELADISNSDIPKRVSKKRPKKIKKRNEIKGKSSPKDTLPSTEKVGEEPTDYPFICKLCARGLPSEKSLGIHMKIHASELKMPCQETDCEETFPSKKSLWEHMNTVHGTIKEDWTGVRLKCDGCEKVFYDKSSFKRHSYKHIKEKNFSCTVCPKRFKGRESLLYHTRRHEGILKFECLECDKKYSCSASLRIHKLHKHTEEQSFTCEHCGKEFNRKEKLMHHLTLHTGEKRLACSTEGCEKRFR